MAFMLGAFTSGLASGAKNAMDMYGEYQTLKSKKQLSDSLTSAMGSGSGSSSDGAQTGVQTGSGGTTPTAQSDSAASAPKSSAPDLGADPRATAGVAAAGEHSNDRDTTTGPAPAISAGGEHSNNRDTTVAPQGVETVSNPQFASGRSTSPANMTTYDQPGAPQSSIYNPAQAAPTTKSQSQSPWMDWLTGRNPQNRAVHLTSTMGVASGPGSGANPMSTSPGGSAKPVGASVSDWTASTPHYLPPGGSQSVQGQGQQTQASRPPALSAGASSTSPTLANQQTAVGQAIQTQYGNGGM